MSYLSIMTMFAMQGYELLERNKPFSNLSDHSVCNSTDVSMYSHSTDSNNDSLKKVTVHFWIAITTNWRFKWTANLVVVLTTFQLLSAVRTTFTCSLAEVEDLDFLLYESKPQILCQRYDAIRHTLPTIQMYLPLKKQSIVIISSLGLLWETWCTECSFRSLRDSL